MSPIELLIVVIVIAGLVALFGTPRAYYRAGRLFAMGMPIIVLLIVMYLFVGWFRVATPLHDNDARPKTNGVAVDRQRPSPADGPSSLLESDPPSRDATKAEVEIATDASPQSEGSPKWINDRPQKRGDAYYVVVRSGEVSHDGMREEALDVKMVAAAQRYIDELLYRESDVAATVKIDASYLRDHCIAAEYTSAENGSGETFVQLKFDQQFRNEVGRRYRQYVSTSRVEQLGSITLGVLGVLAGALAYLRFTKPRDEGVKRTG